MQGITEHRRGCIVQSTMSRTVGHRMTSCGIAQSIAEHSRAGQTNAWHHRASCRAITSHRRTPCGTAGVARHHRPSRGIVGHRIMGHIQTNTHTHTSTLRFTAIHCDPHIMTVHPGHTQGVCQRHQRERYYTKATPCDTIGIYTSYECSSNNSTPSNSSTLQQYLPCDSAVH